MAVEPRLNSHFVFECPTFSLFIIDVKDIIIHYNSKDRQPEMDQEVIVTNTEAVVTSTGKCGNSICSEPNHLLNSPGSIKSLPNRVERLEPTIDFNLSDKKVVKKVVTDPMTRLRRGTSIEMMALRARHLFEDEDVGSDLHLGLRQRKGTLRPGPKRRKSKSPVRFAYRHTRPRARWLIPAEHQFKVIWDILTVVFSVANAYATHVAIRDRKFGSSLFNVFCEVWFFVDILLNFVTERKTAEGDVLRDYRRIAARYLTSWFAVDVLSLFPWETLYVKPIIDIQNRRGFFRKSFFRSKAVVRVSRHLRGRHFRWFGNVARHTKQHGVGASRLLRLLIKYLPKYILFLKNMKGVVAMRALRQINYLRRFYNNLVVDGKGDGSTSSLTKDDVEDDLSSGPSVDSRSVQVEYENWELVDDDDGVPL